MGSLMLSYLAYITNRSFVFDDYTWSRLPLPYTIYDFALRPARIPLNALITGPIAGGLMPSSPKSLPRAVSAEFWQVICPPERRRVITSKDSPKGLSGLSLVTWWKDMIEKHEDAICLEIDTNQRAIFDFRCLRSVYYHMFLMFFPPLSPVFLAVSSFSTSGHHFPSPSSLHILNGRPLFHPQSNATLLSFLTSFMPTLPFCVVMYQVLTPTALLLSLLHPPHSLLPLRQAFTQLYWHYIFDVETSKITVRDSHYGGQVFMVLIRWKVYQIAGYHIMGLLRCVTFHRPIPNSDQCNRTNHKTGSSTIVDVVCPTKKR